MQLTILVGAPGSGKSTYASKQNYDYIINDDDIKDRGCENVSKEISRLLGEYSHSNLKICLDAMIVICGVVSIAKEYNAKIVILDKDVSTCISNNQKRTRHVSEGSIRFFNSYIKSNIEFYQNEIGKDNVTIIH